MSLLRPWVLTARLALPSLRHRKMPTVLTLAAIALAVALVAAVDVLRNSLRDSFTQSLSSTDLIVGARGGAREILLYTVFGLGSPTRNLSWKTYQDVKRHPAVAWALPIGLGDSHRGFRVLGSLPELFESWRYRRNQTLGFAAGRPYGATLLEAVAGAEVAEELGYRLGDQLVLAHGDGAMRDHGEYPFTLVGILQPTGTPADRTVFISLQSLEAIHVGFGEGPPPAPAPPTPTLSAAFEVQQISAILIGTRAKLDTFRLQREIEERESEPLTAILPGVALADFWLSLRSIDVGLRWLLYLVAGVTCLTMAVVLLASLEARRREMAILRALGLGPVSVFALLMAEAATMLALGLVAGLALAGVGLQVVAPFLERWLGLSLSSTAPPLTLVGSLVMVLALGALVALFPAWRAYRQSLQDGLSQHF